MGYLLGLTSNYKNMKYIGEFADINNEIYKVEIQTESGTQTKEITLGGNPFETTMDSEDKHIYSPIKTTGATVRIITADYPFDIYSGKAKGTKVTLSKAGKIVWIGFVTPAIYDMGFDKEREEIEVECVDGIAALKNLQYRTSKHDVRTFAEVIFNCLKQADCYSSFYISDNVQLTPNGTESVIDKFRITEEGFFEERESPDQTDDDLAWTSYDVLYQLIQFLGYSLVVEGDEVFILDYDAIRKGNNTYFKYSLSGSSVSTPIKTTLSYSKHIDGTSYSQDGTSVELDKVYNKVSVKDEFSTFDSLFPEFGDINFEENITVAEDDEFDINCGKSGVGVHYNRYYEGDTFAETDSKGRSNNYQIFITKGESPWNGYLWVIINKFYESPVFDFKRYNSVNYSKMFEDISDNKNYSNRWPAFSYANGAWYVRQYKKKIESSEYNKWRANYPADWYSMTKERRKQAWITFLNNDPQNFTLTPMIIMVNAGPNTQSNRYHIGPAGQRLGGGTGRTDNEDCRHYPFIRLKGERTTTIFGGENSYLIIQGTFIQHDKEAYPFPMSEGSENNNLGERKRYKWNDQFFAWARLQWGDQYWDGEQWVTSPTDFKLWFKSNYNDGESTTVKDYFDKSFDVIDTSQATMLVNEKGYYIPAPKSGNLQGKADFILYCPRDFYGWQHKTWFRGNDYSYSKYYNRIQILKNFQIKAFVNTSGTLGDTDLDSDTVYTNVIDNANVEKMDEITFKVCTYDDKNPNYSSVDYLSEGKSVYVRNTYNKALQSAENGSVGCDGVNASLRQEEHYIFKIASQYEEPRIIMNVNLHNVDQKLYGTYTDKTLSGRTFIATKKEIDYRYNRVNLTLTEKI